MTDAASTVEPAPHGSPAQQLAAGIPSTAVPRFYVTPRQRFSLGSVLLALAIAIACLFAGSYALAHVRQVRAQAEDNDDPSQVDTIYLGDPTEAPVARRPHSDRYHPVHPFVLIHLPRSGDAVGQIPDTPTGRLLYTWLAAFNGTDPSALPRALPSPADASLQAAQLELRRQTGGFTLVSSAEVQPGLLVFRLHDQTPAANEVLGSLQLRPGSSPAAIASFSLRAVPSTPAKP